MEIITARGLFLKILSKDLFSQKDKLRTFCKSVVGRQDLDMNIIGLRVCPLSLAEEAAIWLTELS